jgi:hypothetical protein
MLNFTCSHAIRIATALTGLLWIALSTHAVWAQSAEQGRSYRDRQNPSLSQSGPIYMDPNVYAYSAEFAKRFQMPDEWITPDLQGADAVAWRMMPSYQECGWGRNPKACRQAMKCEIDLYFDHKRHPLPWDATRPERHARSAGSSLWFLANFPRIEAVKHPNYPVALRKLREPARAGDHFAADDSPFIDPQSGKGLSIQYFSRLDVKSGWGYELLTGYDKEVFPGMALVTILDPGCDGKKAAYAWASRGLDYFNQQDKAIVHAVLTPQSWRDRVAKAAQEHSQRQEAFFKQESEKAMRALRESPVPVKPLVPVQ